MSSLGSGGSTPANPTTSNYGSIPAQASGGAPSEPANSSVPPGYANNTRQSGSLTNYLQKHKLPLVGAQVLANSNGNRQVILYGFVATDFGKQDAADKARRYLSDPDMPVINRIQVRPELASGSGQSGSAPGQPSGAYGSTGSAESPELGNAQAYQQQQQEAEQQQQQYMQQSQATGSALSSLMPLIGMMGMLNMGSGGFGIGSGGYGMGGYGYPGSGYGYPGYGSPYGAPYGYGGSPYATPYTPYSSFGFGGFP